MRGEGSREGRTEKRLQRHRSSSGPRRISEKGRFTCKNTVFLNESSSNSAHQKGTQDSDPRTDQKGHQGDTRTDRKRHQKQQQKQQTRQQKASKSSKKQPKASPNQRKAAKNSQKQPKKQPKSNQIAAKSTKKQPKTTQSNQKHPTAVKSTQKGTQKGTPRQISEALWCSRGSGCSLGLSGALWVLSSLSGPMCGCQPSERSELATKQKHYRFDRHDSRFSQRSNLSRFPFYDSQVFFRGHFDYGKRWRR